MRRKVWRMPDTQLLSEEDTPWLSGLRDNAAVDRGEYLEYLGELEIPDSPPPPPPHPLPYDLLAIPEPLRLLHVQPHDLLPVVAPQPGTHFVLHGEWDVRNIRLNKWTGTPEHPIVIQGADDFVFRPTTWEGLGKSASILDISGEHLILDKLTFDGIHGLGRLLTISSAPDRGESHDIRVQRCAFRASYSSAIVAQGHNLKFYENKVYANCRVNQNHSMDGGWPYTMGLWPYALEANGPRKFCRDCEYIRNYVHHNHGEGIHPSYSIGALVRDNHCHENLYVNIALNNAAYAVVAGNRIEALESWKGHSNDPPRGIEAWVEKTSTNPMQPNTGIVISNNTIRGNNLLNVGIQWRRQKNNSDAPENTYHDMTIQGNEVSGCLEARLRMEAVPSVDKPTDCVSDMPEAADVIYADREGWTIE